MIGSAKKNSISGKRKWNFVDMGLFCCRAKEIRIFRITLTEFRSYFRDGVLRIRHIFFTYLLFILCFWVSDFFAIEQFFPF